MGRSTKELTIGSRTTRRYAIPAELDAWIEVVLDGRCWCLSLLDLSEDGLSFECTGDVPEAQLAAALDDVLLQAGEYQIRVAVTLRYVEKIVRGGSLCGGLMRPQTKADGKRLDQLLGDLRDREAN